MSPFESDSTKSEEVELHSGDDESTNGPPGRVLVGAPVFNQRTIVLVQRTGSAVSLDYSYKVSLICDDSGIPQFSKLADLIAGTLRVNSTRVSVCPVQSCSVKTIHDNSDLLCAFTESSDSDMAFHIGFKTPPHLRLTLGDRESSIIFEIGSILTSKWGKPSYASLLTLAASKLNTVGVLKILGNDNDVIATDDDLLEFLQSTSSDVAEVFVVEPHLLISIEGQDKLPPLKIGYSSIAASKAMMSCISNLQNVLTQRWKVGSMQFSIAASGSVLANNEDLLLATRKAESGLLKIAACPDPIVLRDKSSLPLKFRQPYDDIASWTMKNVVPGRYEVSWSASAEKLQENGKIDEDGHEFVLESKLTEECSLCIGLVELNQGESIADAFSFGGCSIYPRRYLVNREGGTVRASKPILVTGAARETLFISMDPGSYHPFSLRAVTLHYDGPLSWEN